MGLAAIAALVGAFIQSATGFGFALVLSPALFAVLEPEEAVGTLLVLGLALNLLVLVEGGWHADWRRVAPMLVAALPGLVVGVVLLSALSKEALQVIVGLAVIAAGAWQLVARRAASGERHRTELPAAAPKMAMLSRAIETFGQQGYVYIGMDHFALHSDPLSVARKNSPPVR